MASKNQEIEGLHNLRASILSAAAKSSKILITFGIIFCILGVCGLIWQFALSKTAIHTMGWVLAAAGFFQFVYAMRTGSSKSAVLQFFFATIYATMGLCILLFPMQALEILVLWLSFAFLVLGILRLIIALQYRRVSGWHWQIISAAISIVIAILLLNSYPLFSLWLPSFLISLELLLQGWSLIFVGIASHKLPANSKFVHRDISIN